MKHTLIMLVAFSVLATAQVKLEGAPSPKLTNANVKQQAVSVSLDATMSDIATHHKQAAWVLYIEPIVAGPRMICCSDNWSGDRARCCNSCSLESRNHNNFDTDESACLTSGPPTHMFILVRVESGAVQKVRAYTPDCALDAGGLDVILLEGVKPAESVAWLEKQIIQSVSNDTKTPRGIMDGALQSLALHADASADSALERMLQPVQPTISSKRKLREQTAFWVSQTRGHKGFLLLQRLARNDSDDRFREQLTFPISQSNDPDALTELVRMARNDASKRVRGQAIFWLSQKAGHKAAEAISDALENDPETDVKKKAVFALSQLPRDESVPLLIKYAGSSRNPSVRKEAIFWLGQSGDPRALDFLEQLVTGQTH
jgi:hypothetical protein